MTPLAAGTPLAAKAAPRSRRGTGAQARLRKEVLATARGMSELDLVAGTLGNVSGRLPEGVVITPTQARYDLLVASDLCFVGSDGAVPAGRRTPSRELPMHLAIYRARPDVGAIVHTHSLYATAWSFVGGPLTPRLEDLDYYVVGDVRTSIPARAGTPELAHRAVDALGTSRAALIGGHGVVAVGSSPWEALTIAQLVERQATVTWLLRNVRAGGV